MFFCFVLKPKTTFFHLLSFAATRWITRCHSLSFVVTRCHSLYHSLSLIVTRFIARLSFYKRSCLNCQLKIRKWFKSNENRYFNIELNLEKNNFLFLLFYWSRLLDENYTYAGWTKFTKSFYKKSTCCNKKSSRYNKLFFSTNHSDKPGTRFSRVLKAYSRYAILFLDVFVEIIYKALYYNANRK